MADSDVTVLIEGESGTGKELVARTIHLSSARAKKPFISVNCAAFAEPLLEAELFGHAKGGFTGALADKPGRFQLADGGTLFLDEIGDLPAKGQGDLLRVLEDGTFRPVGGTQLLHVNVRIVAATNKRLQDVAAASFMIFSTGCKSCPSACHCCGSGPRTSVVDRFVSRHFAAKHKRRCKQLAPEAMQLCQQPVARQRAAAPQ